MKNLEELILIDNKLTEIKNATFIGANKLKKIFLIMNKIENIENDAFNLPSLEEIRLGRNALKTIPKDLFMHAPHLKLVTLLSNHLTSIDFDLPTELEQFDIMNNPLGKIDLNMFMPFPSLKTLYFDDTTNNVKFPVDTKVTSDLERLNLASNVFPDGNVVLQQLKCFPKLQFLSINVEKFANGVQLDQSIEEMFPNMKILRINDCEVENYGYGFDEDKCIRDIIEVHDDDSEEGVDDSDEDDDANVDDDNVEHNLITYYQ